LDGGAVTVKERSEGGVSVPETVGVIAIPVTVFVGCWVKARMGSGCAFAVKVKAPETISGTAGSLE
jgi:hypothetical protein